MKTSWYRLGKARKILQEMLTAVNTFLKDKSFTYFEEVKADFHMFKSQRVFNLVSAKVTKFSICTNQCHLVPGGRICRVSLSAPISVHAPKVQTGHPKNTIGN